MKDLWQYIDAKYFIKYNKYELISKIDYILNQILTSKNQVLDKDKTCVA